MTGPVQAPAGWYRDPGTHHEYRYWNGTTWTEYVGDHGMTAQEKAPADALPPPPGSAPEKQEPASTASEDFKSRFAAAEWDLVMSLPHLFFVFMAARDGSIADAEFKVWSDRMSKGALGYKDPMHREVVREFFSSPVTSEQLIRKANEAGPAQIRDLLKRHLSADEYQGYVGSVWIDALAVARAEDGVSAKEQEALANLATFFGVDVEALQKRWS